MQVVKNEPEERVCDEPNYLPLTASDVTTNNMAAL